MELYLSKTIELIYRDFDIDYLLWNINQIAHKLDSDIPTESFYVSIRKSRYPRYFAGHAYPYTTFMDLRRGKYIICPNGRISMSLGTLVNEEDICCLFSHELRHLGQAARQRKDKGYLTFNGLNSREIESDCRSFEERVVTKMGY